MGDERRLARRLQGADIGEMVAVALGAEMLDGLAGQVAQQRVGGELRHHRLGRTQLLAARTPARAEMGDLVHGIEQRSGSDAREDRDRHGAADIGRVHAGMDGLGSSDAADRNGAERPGRTGIGHDGAGTDDRRAQQRLHGARHSLDIAGLFGRARVDVEVQRHGAAGLQRNGGRRLEAARRGEGFVERAALLQMVIGGGERRAKPLALAHAGIDEVLAADGLGHVVSPGGVVPWSGPAPHKFIIRQGWPCLGWRQGIGKTSLSCSPACIRQSCAQPR
jgi:hypothetical protein